MKAGHRIETQKPRLLTQSSFMARAMKAGHRIETQLDAAAE